MNGRKKLSKSLRFEVFKRDSFSCVYCGRSAPDVVLHVDHVVPVSKGGTNEITNLVTACSDCNLGKSNRKLDDKSMVAKQKRQLDELNERREQLEMMKQWNDELNNLENETVEYVSDLFQSLTGVKPNNRDKSKLRHYLKKYGMQAVIDGIKDSIEKNFKGTDISAELALNRIEKHVIYKLREKESPELNEILYIRGILKNRFGADFEGLKDAVQRMTDIVDKGILSTDALKEIALTEESLDCWYFAIDYHCCMWERGLNHESKKNR